MTTWTRARAMAAALDEIDGAESPNREAGGSQSDPAPGSAPSSIVAPPPPGVEPRADAIRPASAGAGADTASYGVRPENAGAPT